MITYAPNNIIVNSAAPATQTVAVSGGVAYILSFTGTGAVVASGAASFTLAGNGSRVYTKFTPVNNGNLTLTVSGSVTLAMLEAVTYQISPRDYIATTSAAYFGPRWQDGGLLVESSATNLVVQSHNYSSSSWTKLVGALTVGEGVSPLGTTPSLWTYTGSGAESFLFTPPISVTAGVPFSAALFFKPATQSSCIFSFATASYAQGVKASFNAVTMTASVILANSTTGVSVSIVALPGGWFMCRIAGTPTSNYAGNVLITNSTAGGFLVGGTQFERAAALSSYIPTGATAVTRAPDVGSFIVPSGWQNALYTYADESTQIVPVTAGATHTILPSTVPLKTIERAA